VGIGTASPATILDIQSAGVVFARIQNTTSTADAYLLVKNTTGEGFFGINALGPYIYTASALPIVFTTATSERYRIAGDGVATWSNVGGVAGTAMTLNSTGLGVGGSPSAKLDVSANDGTMAIFRSSGGSSNDKRLTISSGGAKVVFNISDNSNTATARAYEFQTAGSAAMTLTANGNLLIGTTTDVSTVKMQVWSPDSNNTVYFRNSNATTPYGPSIKYTAATPNNTGSEFLYCEDSTALRVSLRSNGGIANYQANDVSLSDSRLKTDIKPLASYWNKIKSLELVTFKYKDQTHSDDNIGLIAQQVESVAPELVDVDGFGETPADGVPLKTIYTTDLYHASIKALQEAMARIEALEAKLA
jgi:hypothetical protein